MLKSLDIRLAEIQDAFAKITDRTDDEIVNLFTNYCKSWEDYIGISLTQGAVVKHSGIKYLVMQDIATVLETQSPSMDGMLALYKPYREKGVYEWLYGEYCTIGDVRYIISDENVIYYTAIQDAGANIY